MQLYLVVFMFYMNNSNLLIRITELSIERVSNWIQTTQALRQVSRKIHRNSSALHTFWQRSRSEIEHLRGQELLAMVAAGRAGGWERVSGRAVGAPPRPATH